jgi:NADPH2:quinone reductase
MLAIRVHEFGGPDQLRAEEVDDPAPAAGQVRIAVAYAGVHLLDAALRKGQPLGPFGRPTLPVTPGREVAGIVDAIGDGIDAHKWLGARVVCNLGPRGGGYAEFVVAPHEALHVLPDEVGFDDAVAMIGTGTMALSILELGAPTAGDLTVVTAAAGGIGTLLIQGLHQAGAEVIGLVGSGAKLAELDRLGVRWAFSYAEDGWQDRVRNDVGMQPITLAFDAVGGAVGRAALELLDVGGRLVLYGEASGSVCEVTGEDLFVRGIEALAAAGARLLRRPGGLRPLEEQALTATGNGMLAPVIGQRFPLENAAAAHRALEGRTTIGKTLLRTSLADTRSVSS